MRLQTSATSVFLLLVGILALSSGGSAGPVRDDAVDGAWLSGYLTWKEGKGGINWQSTNDTEDRIKPDPDDQTGMVPAEFVSDPLPRTIHLNASRNIQVDVNLVAGENPPYCESHTDENGAPSTTSGAFMGIELFADGRRLGGTSQDRHLISTYVDRPEGFVTCRYRLAPEIGTLEAGTIIHLRLLGAGHYIFGFDEEHPSVIRLSFYAPEDLFWRQPELFEEVLNGEPSSPSLLDGIWGIIGGGALVALAPPRILRRRWRTIALCVLLAAAGMSGCLASSGGKDADGGPSNVNPEDQVARSVQDSGSSDLAGAGRGAILGVVHDPEFVPIAGAHVATIGASHFADTNTIGRFQMLNISAGTYRLRVDKKEYQSLEFTATVEADKITRLQVTLIPTDTRGRDFRPHRHDYWDKATSLEVFNGTFGKCPAYPIFLCTPVDIVFGIPASERDGPDLVMPGTKMTEVILDWEPNRLGFARLGLLVQHNGDLSPDNRSHFALRGPGEPFHVLTNWEMSDVGHQRFSTWQFTAERSPGEDTPRNPVVLQEDPALRIVIRVHKGAVPLEPAHPDHWKGRERLVVDEGQTWTPTHYSTLFGAVVSDVYAGCSEAMSEDGGAHGHFRAAWSPPANVVPTGADRVVVEVNLSRPTGVQGAGAYDLELWYKPGDLPLQTQFIGEGAQLLTLPPNPAFQLADAPTWSNGDKTATWTLKLEPGQADGTYNKRSAWQFVTMPADPLLACLDAHAHVATDPMILSLTVRAER